MLSTISSESDVDLVSIAADSAFEALTAGAATRSQFTIAATSQFSEVSSRLGLMIYHVQNQCSRIPLNGHPTQTQTEPKALGLVVFNYDKVKPWAIIKDLFPSSKTQLHS